MKNKIINIGNRIYSDYLMPSRLNEYEKIIKESKKKYKHITLREYKKILTDDLFSKKYLINRHDIDTDIKTAKEFFKIEKKYNVKATYYFRLSTLDIEFMKEIEDYGSEASYHFEEIAQFAKDNHIKSKYEIKKNFYEIKKKFKKNLKIIEKNMEVKITTVCSHGDFVNRKLNIINNEFLKDTSLREELGILCEAYDKEIMNNVDIYLSDGNFSLDAKAEDILLMISNKNIIYMLTHPRQWKSRVIENTKDNIKRVYESMKW